MRSCPVIAASRSIALAVALGLAATAGGCGPSGGGGVDGGGSGGGGDGGGGGGGTSPFDPSVSCGLQVVLSGGLDATVTASDEIACTTPFASKNNVEASFAGTSSSRPTVDLAFVGLTKGQTAADLAGTIELHKSQSTWTGDSCTVTVISNDMTGTGDFGDNFRIAGHADCDPAHSNIGGDVTIGPLDFVMTVTWP